MQLTETQAQQQQAGARVSKLEYTEDSRNTIEPSNADDSSSAYNTAASKPWYFAGGKRQPRPARKSRKTRKRVAKLFPHEDVWSDRITNQLMFVPPNYEETLESRKHKTILLYNGLGPWNVKPGRETFTNLKCPVYTCNITANRAVAHTADLVLYKDYFIPTGVARSPKQLYMLYFLECPYHTQHVKLPDAFNWTATYRYVMGSLRYNYVYNSVVGYQ